MDINKAYWIGVPKNYEIKDNKINMTTLPFTDLWKRTYYGFCIDNAHKFVIDCENKFFSFTVKTEFESSNQRFDQCGIVVYLDSDNWLKCSAEYENKNYQHLGSVVTNNGYSDWATTAIPADIKTIWYRLSRRGEDFCLENSFDGITYGQMRICHLSKATDTIRVGIYACSPQNSTFTATFSDMQINECQWKAHT